MKLDGLTTTKQDLLKYARAVVHLASELTFVTSAKFTITFTLRWTKSQIWNTHQLQMSFPSVTTIYRLCLSWFLVREVIRSTILSHNALNINHEGNWRSRKSKKFSLRLWAELNGCRIVIDSCYRNLPRMPSHANILMDMDWDDVWHGMTFCW